VLAGSREVVVYAVRYRRMAGGAMRQVGIFAAAGLYALDHNVERLAEDHANARVIAERVAESRHVLLDPATVRTNILVFGLADDGPRRTDPRRDGRASGACSSSRSRPALSGR